MSWTHILLLTVLVVLGLILVKRRAESPRLRRPRPLDIVRVQRASEMIARANATVAPTSTSTPVVESVSVVLRRQVPVRFDEPPRSWIGGLPMMPDSTEWPLGPTMDYPERGRTPLHFIPH